MSIKAILAGKGTEVATIDSAEKLSQAVTKLGERRIGALVVIEQGQIAGIFSERDLVYCLKEHGSDVLGWPVSRAMTSPAITVDPATSALAALGIMTRRRIRHLPVVEGGHLAGIVSIGDLVKYRMEKIEQEANAMREYIQSA